MRKSFEGLTYSIVNELGRKKPMTLKGEEFIRRFEQHILPKGLHLNQDVRILVKSQSA